MGWNTVVLIRNDAFGDIEQHPQDFVRGIRVAMHQRERRDRELRVGNHVNAAQVVTCDHADATHVILAGQNYATDLGAVFYSGGHHEPDKQVAILKDIAARLGYNLVRKPPKG